MVALVALPILVCCPIRHVVRLLFIGLVNIYVSHFPVASFNNCAAFTKAASLFLHAQCLHSPTDHLASQYHAFIGRSSPVVSPLAITHHAHLSSEYVWYASSE